MTNQPLQGKQSQNGYRSGFEERLARFANWLVLGIARHWLALFNTAWGIYVIVPFLAPIFMHLGFTFPARIIYGVYSFACHQLPDHSYFLFGPNPAPLLPDLEALGMTPGLDLLGQRRFIGNAEAGYKVALCQRDIGIYSSVFLAGLAYSRLRGRIHSPSLKVYALFVLPMAIDGLTQLFGFRESTWFLRSITGAMFGAGSIWLAYPYVDEAMQDVIDSEEERMAEAQRAYPSTH
jgi:uncharacterized membrane protein